MNLLDELTLQSIAYMEEGELEEALACAWLAVQKYPLSGDAFYNLAFFYEKKGEWLLAYKNYLKASYIYDYLKDEKAETLEIAERLEKLLEKILNTTEQREKEKILIFLQEQCEAAFGLKENFCRTTEQIIGKQVWVTETEKRYVGLHQTLCNLFLKEGEWDLIHNKGIFLKAKEGASYYVEGMAEEYLLPIAVETDNTFHLFKKGKEKYKILQREACRFNYYRVKNETMLASSGKCFYGNPIPLGHNEKRKKLVLNVFIDGLSQEVLKGEDFQQLMPNTYRFFRKGSICTQAYSCSEWTYPSIATYATGLASPEHMLLHSDISTLLPLDVPTIAEYFKEAGYFTAIMTTDWRQAPGYGYIRGYDQFIYKHHAMTGGIEHGVGEAIGQIEAFKETDQFIWLCFGDLHDIADELDCKIAVQSQLKICDRVIESDGQTSVRQGHNENKIVAYKQKITYMDIMLDILWHYIESNYKEEEIIVSLFSDHGQGYLKPDSSPFMAKERAKVAFMFRGNGKGEIIDEIISTADYISIMCKLAEIPMRRIETSSHLPVCFGGESEREYAIAESIFPGAPYYATVYTKKYRIYFENGAITEQDLRFPLKDYKIWATDLDDRIVADEELLNYYFKIIEDHIQKLIL